MDILYVSPDEQLQKLSSHTSTERMEDQTMSVPYLYRMPYPHGILPTPPAPPAPTSVDHMLFQGNMLNKVLQDMVALQQRCEKQQQKIEELEGRLASMQSLEERILSLETMEAEQRLSYLEGLVQPKQPVSYVPMYPAMHSVDPLASMMHAIHMAQMVQAASQQSAMMTNPT